MKHRIRSYTGTLVFVALAAATLLLAACGGKQSVASKSAAAFREAQAKETSVGEPSHGGHAATPDGSLTTSTDHTGMSEPEHATPDMDHSTMAGMGHAQAGKQQERVPHGQHGQKTPSGASPPAMEHGSMQHGMQHGGTTSQAEGLAEVRQVDAHPGQPASTLDPDPLDTPAPTSVSDSARSAEMAQMMTSPGHAMAHGEYVHQDVGRDAAPMQHGVRGPEEKPVYTCPMHPDVKSDAPGTCPKCGMTLVKKEKK